MKPEFWTSEQVAECDPLTRLLFIGLWNFADDAGRHPWRPKQIKMRIYPADDITTDQVEQMLEELERNGLIDSYVSEGERYFVITGWKHQKIDRRSDPVHPAPPPFSTRTRRPLDEDSEGERERRREGSLIGREGETRAPEEKTAAPEPQAVGQVAAALGLGLGLGDKEIEEAEACLAAYQLALPELQAATPFDKWTAKRRAAWDLLRTELGDERPKTKDDWLLYFNRVAESDFLMGVEGKFKAELTWLLNPEHVKKVMEGKYDG